MKKAFDYKTMLNLGMIHLGDKVHITDPVHDLDIPYSGHLENVLPGEYRCFIGFYDRNLWTDPVESIAVCHKDYKTIPVKLAGMYVGVDSGLAGIFDMAYFTAIKNDLEKEKEWYKRVYDSTFTKIMNPDFIEEPCYIASVLGVSMEKYEEMCRDESNEVMQQKIHDIAEAYPMSSKGRRFINRRAGSTIDDAGLVSVSGHGEGEYRCHFGTNSKKQIVCIGIRYI